MNARLAVLWLAACGGKADVPATGSSGPGAGSTARSADVSELDHSDPAYAVVDRSFGNKKPAFPLLSKDGNTAVVEIVTPIGQSGASTYSVSFVPTGVDAWAGSEPEVITLVDATLVHLLVDAKESSVAATIDVDTIGKGANGIIERIAAGGFSRFEGSVAIGAAATAGPFTIGVSEEATKAIMIRVGENGKPLATEQIQPVPTGIVGDIECLAAPVIKRGWFDGARKRLLLHVGWKTNAAQCSAPDTRYRLIGAR